VVLRDDDALVIGAGFDFDVDACWSSVLAGSGAGEGVMVQGHLDGGVFGGAFDAGFDVGGDADVDVLGVGYGCEKNEGGEQAHEH
jgi:hypothetical protein